MVHARFSLHNRRFIYEPSEANAAFCAKLETSANSKCETRGKEKNKAPVTGPLFWLFRPPTPTALRRWCQKDQSKHTLGARYFFSAVSAFCQVFIVTRGFGRRCVGLWPTPKISTACEKNLLPRVIKTRSITRKLSSFLATRNTNSSINHRKSQLRGHESPSMM